MTSTPKDRAKRLDQRSLGDPGSAEFQVDRYPFYLLNRAVSRYNIVIGARLRAIGLDIPNWRVLMVLGEHAPRSIGQIAEASVINLSTMMRIIGRMSDAGLVTSAPGSEDARVTEVDLTQDGRVKLAEARAATAPVYANLIEGFSATDFDRMIGLLNRLHDNLDRVPP
ncbi:MarR family transcriptional regulator [Sphingomonas populi]|uniref:MarR family transcriptional regulator n=1 Tax=Sphingomonas populi TaxID=2484750 RepID=A0A4Q6Y1D9_9SPHN|nr:MarR family winged helix-turn-helix transcriptional regulator [Sphingomonas populi]RZF63524.1 MarR family transcriptional regulator [Sphingomonas populi]